MRGWVAVLALAGLAAAGTAWCGDRLLATGGAQQVEGGGGGGLNPWAVIAGYGTRDQVGGSAFATRLRTGDFRLDAAGVALGMFDRLEVSAAKMRFDAGSVVPGLTLKMDTVGAKVRLLGDALYDQDSALPQVSVGIQHKRNTEMAIPSAIGARRGSDTDFYVSATKIWLAAIGGRNLIANATFRATRANQFGLLGFGGDRRAARSLQPEFSMGLMLTDEIVLGAEYRGKPDNLSAFREQDASDLFIAWFPSRHAAVTLAWVRLGSVAGRPGQDGPYLSLQLTL